MVGPDALRPISTCCLCKSYVLVPFEDRITERDNPGGSTWVLFSALPLRL